MTLFYTYPSQYLTNEEPPVLVIQNPRKYNPWLALLANPRFAFTPTSNVTTSGTALSGVEQNYHGFAFGIIPDYSFVEQIENLKELKIPDCFYQGQEQK